MQERNTYRLILLHQQNGAKQSRSLEEARRAEGAPQSSRVLLQRRGGQRAGRQSWEQRGAGWQEESERLQRPNVQQQGRGAEGIPQDKVGGAQASPKRLRSAIGVWHNRSEVLVLRPLTRSDPPPPPSSEWNNSLFFCSMLI